MSRTKHYITIIEFSTNGDPYVALQEKMIDLSAADVGLLSNYVKVFSRLGYD
jgi:hypothetical protein